MQKRFLLFGLIVLLTSCGGVDQIFAPVEKEKDPTKPDITLEDEKPQETDTIPDAEERIKRNVFYGEKTKKAHTSIIERNTTDYRLFYVLPEPVAAAPYVRKVFYHDAKNNTIRSAEGKGQVLDRVLHGPYERIVNDVVIEKGDFYYGTKHGTWLYQRMDSTLYEKEHYTKGWFTDSQITYYDEDQKTKMKEVIPFQYGKKEGTYYRFYESGNIAVTGEYVFDKKVGVWIEYHDVPGVVVQKRWLQYPKVFYDWDFEPYIVREWNKNSQTIYNSPKTGQ
ncbi:MAG: hypothetical protein JJ978_00300 [Roseivirga sp.]|jgi:antitoxin component YwqK of YwqJK toxin-antitoxin module|uniref:toxin-antitoxin system YwqK family antitoxin n=1 Tax=Roseivirga sp. TaxID=1964215 RepID=UPI001B2B9545|nr:hypothetical protein [Roseivirga sp.]MBO6493978.1 hypothetical protein [Roseivirga sp.]